MTGSNALTPVKLVRVNGKSLLNKRLAYLIFRDSKATTNYLPL